MTYVLKTNENINTLALAYFDDITETLKEVSPDTLRINVGAYQRTLKRFYIIGELMYKYGIEVEVSVGNGYEAQVLLGLEDPRFSDFWIAGPYASADFNDSWSYRYLNAVPVDILVRSTEYSSKDVTINIKIKAVNNMGVPE